MAFLPRLLQRVALFLAGDSNTRRLRFFDIFFDVETYASRVVDPRGEGERRPEEDTAFTHDLLGILNHHRHGCQQRRGQ